MTNEQRVSIIRIRSTWSAADRAQFHVCVEAGIAVFADLHKRRALADRAVRS